MKLKDNSTQEIDTALYQLEQRLKSNIRLTDVENSNASTAKINAVDKKLTEEVKDRQSADGKLQDNINKEIADRQEADAAIENAKQDKLIAGNNIQIDGNVISAISTEYTAEAPVKVTDGKISLDTVPITKGGTGVTTQGDINKAFVSNLESGESDVTDGTEFVSSFAKDSGFSSTEEGSLNKPYKRQFVKVWNYIKGKISSVLGLTATNYGGTANKATNDGDGNNIVDTYALKSNLQYTKSINIDKVDGSSGTLYYLIATTESTNSSGNIDSLFVIGSDYRNRMFEGAITTRDANYVYNYGKDNLPIELYEQTNGVIYVYWLVSDSYNRVALNITATDFITTYGGNLSPVTPTGSKMTLTEYDYKSYETLPVARGGTGATTAHYAFANLASELPEGVGPLDEEHMLFQNSNNGKVWGRYTLFQFWEYIKGKISSVLGLTKDTYSGKSAQSGYLAKYASSRLTSGNIVPKDSSEYGGMRKDVVTSSMTDSGRPGQDGHLLTMFWDSDGRWDSQLFVSNENPQTVKVRFKDDTADYGTWTDIITSNNIGSQTVASAGNADNLFYSHGNEINFKGGAQTQCWFNYRNADTEGPSPVDTMEYRFCNYSGDTSKSVLIAGTAKASNKMVIPIGAPSSLEDGCIWVER